ncbi:MAG: hypothetical protein COA96_02380 [SAR86 cluster bacterium]|uniref:Uncharacterized protein n=1 Tax=SAR86 cluster bacterium TaxID=2030880 RepID=A0A2A5B932_9GAMM|nr:MAG: hypothetical protein COA96_02380 [SAR86 cluster bacterium]
MKFLIHIAAIASLLSCSEKDDVFAPYKAGSEPATQFSVDDVRTYDELEIYLRGKYGDIQPLPSYWSGSGDGDSGSGPFSFRLSDGSEISIDGLYNRATGQIVDPNYDLRSLPDIATNYGSN